MMKPKFSFIIPTRNEAGYLEDCLLSIKSQSKHNHEIIVVDTNSSDGTKKIAKKHAKLINEPRRGIGLARNTGARRARGDMLIFADADVRFDQDFLERIEKKFENDIGGGICALECYDGNGYAKRLYNFINYIPRLMISIGKPLTAGSCFVYSKKYFDALKGFKDEWLTNEDHELARRMHKHRRFVFLNDIKVHTSSRRIRQMGFLRLLLFYIKSSAVFGLKNSYVKGGYPE
jgi:glycosyltransferase involved in cell wall biosynthesis